jgi:3-mercaptopyruvate sulfurtransferase SseA
MRVNTVTPLAPGPYLASPSVSTQWLADHLGADNLAIVEAANRVRLLSLQLDHAATTVIVYDDSDGLCAHESARALLDAGYERVAVLTGGRAAWLLERRPGDLDSLAHRSGRPPLYPGYVEPRLA